MGLDNVRVNAWFGNLPVWLSLFLAALVVAFVAACTAPRIRSLPAPATCPSGYRFLYSELRPEGDAWAPFVVCERSGGAQ